MLLNSAETDFLDSLIRDIPSTGQNEEFLRSEPAIVGIHEPTLQFAKTSNIEEMQMKLDKPKQHRKDFRGVMLGNPKKEK